MGDAPAPAAQARPRGLKAVAIVLMITGGVAVWSSFKTAILGVRLPSDAEIEQLLDGAAGSYGQRSGKTLPPKQRDHLKAWLTDFLQQVKAVVDHPMVRGSYVLGLLLSLATGASGIGLLLGKTWSRPVALWQAAVTLPHLMIGLWLWHRFAPGLIDSISGLIADTSGRQFRDVLLLFLNGCIWAAAASSALWNVWLLWFLNKPAIKDYFTRRTQTTAGDSC